VTHAGVARRFPLLPLLVSSAAAALALAVALWLTRADEDAGWQTWQQSVRLTSTPERVAESFVDALRAQGFQRAARFATGPLAAGLQQRRDGLPREPRDGRRFLLQESHWLPQGRLRLVGALLRSDEQEAGAPTLELTLTQQGGRWLVDDIEGAEYLDSP
jgi:hypothetical protein